MAKEDLIQCGGHGLVPWHIVCNHLIEGTSNDWVLVPLADDDGRDVEGDYLCPECDKEHMRDELDIAKLQAVCMHCVRRLRAAMDPKYVVLDL